MELANVQIQSGHLMRISQFWTGQMKGFKYACINDYIISLKIQIYGPLCIMES
jgi:hypothetical protein